MDIESVLIALNTKDRMSEKILKNEKKKINAREDIDNVKAGRKTIKTLFKNKDDAMKMEMGIETVSTRKQLTNIFRLRGRTKPWISWER